MGRRNKGGFCGVGRMKSSVTGYRGRGKARSLGGDENLEDWSGIKVGCFRGQGRRYQRSGEGRGKGRQSRGFVSIGPVEEKSAAIDEFLLSSLPPLFLAS